ncbi:Exosome complex component MTR3 [Eumeta japonica]|uniref:Exosome complex component MTR3 n=1 Tax=Eumeta variegata TaxID=151549 RepID=A0A4C1V6S1_EUMVA|nr:Exosome complex component MTR3 [Eumeta japonica]
MPLDYKRFNPPEDCVSYKRFTKDSLKSPEQLENEILIKEELRKDGRALSETRPIFVSTEAVSQAKGSAYVELGSTKVICSVYDPREIPHQNEFSQLGHLFCEVKFAPFSCPRQRRSHAPDAEERTLSAALKQALEPVVCRNMFPNYQVDIFVYIIENNGSCFAAAINAAGLALVDAAVPMYDIVTASSMAVVGDNYFLDPTEEEEFVALNNTGDINHGVITMATMDVLQQITNFTQIGSMDVTSVNLAMVKLEQECANLVPVIQQCIVKKTVEGLKIKKKLEDAAKEREKTLDDKIDIWKKKLQAG